MKPQLLLQKLTKFLLIFFIISFCIAKAQVSVTGITLSSFYNVIGLGNRTDIYTNIEPFDATNKNVTYTINPTNAGDFSNNSFVSSTTGVVTITATSVSNPTVLGIYVLTVLPILPIASLEFTLDGNTLSNNITLYTLENKPFWVTTNPNHKLLSDSTVTIEISDPTLGNVTNVFNNLYTFNSNTLTGIVTITARSVSNPSIFKSMVFTILKGGSITKSPNRSESLTLLGFYTPTPPQIDGDLNEYSWLNSGAGYNGTTFPITNDLNTSLVKEQININDQGVARGTPPQNPFTNYAPFSATIGVMWDTAYLYLAAKVIDPISANANSPIVGAGIEYYFNNGNGRGYFQPGEPNFPRKYDNTKDMQVKFNYSSVATLPREIIGSDFSSYGLPLNSAGYKAVTKATTDGYIIEAKISWKTINYEFINELTNIYSDLKWFPSLSRPLLGFDMGMNIPNANLTERESMLMWNQCCINTNWTQSQYFGYLKLVVGTVNGVVCPTSVNITCNPNTITQPQQTAIAEAIVTPTNSTNNVVWKINGKDNLGNPIAKIDQNTGLVTPLGNGIVTITSTNYLCESAKTSAMYTISGQVVAESLSIEIDKTIYENGTLKYYFKANILPLNAANKNVVWSSSASSWQGFNKDDGSFFQYSSSNLKIVTITATSVSNPSIASDYVLTILSNMPIEYIYLNLNSSTITYNRTIDLYAKTFPFYAADSTLIWEISDNSLGTLSIETTNSNGTRRFTANTISGVAEITVRSLSYPAITKKIEITILKEIPLINFQIVSFEIVSLYSYTYLNVNYTPYNTSERSINWSIEPSNLGYIDGNNNFIAGSITGIVTITATSVSKPNIKQTMIIEITSNEISLLSYLQFGITQTQIVSSDGSNLTINIKEIPNATSFCFKYSTDSLFQTNVVTVCGLALPRYTISFSFINGRTESKNLYWQIGAVDANGNTFWSSTQRYEAITSISNTTLDNSRKVEIHPNPSTDFIHIEGLKPNESISIFDLSGKLMQEDTKSDLDIKDLPQGIYIIKVANKVSKFVKQ